MPGSTQSDGPKPISWGVTATVFFLGSVLLWADRTNFSVAAAAWAREYGWTPSTIGMMLSAFSLGYLILQPGSCRLHHADGRRNDDSVIPLPAVERDGG